MEDIENIIDRAVNRAVDRLVDAGVIQTDQRTPEQKTEELLFKYEQFCLSDQPFTQKVVAQIDDALKTIKDDPYYSIIPMYYFQGQTREVISLDLKIHPKTIRKHKRRLIRKMAAVLFSDDVINEIYKE